MSVQPDLGASENPSQWRFTWEAQSQIPVLRLFLFNTNVKPSAQCIDLGLDLANEKFSLTVTWLDYGLLQTSIVVPVPLVLIDIESPPQFKLLDDHIDVRLDLLLPVDHSIFSDLDSVLCLDEPYVQEGSSSYSQTLSIDSGDLTKELKKLSSSNGVLFYCRNCSIKLTESLRFFEELPSLNWRESADNWFGACCCSFGGVSEKLVSSYAQYYTCPSGMCFLNASSIILRIEDLMDCKSFDWTWRQNNESELRSAENSSPGKATPGNQIGTCEIQCESMQETGGKTGCLSSQKDRHLVRALQPVAVEKVINRDSLSCTFPTLNISRNDVSLPECCNDMKNTWSCHTGCCMPNVLRACSKDQGPERNISLSQNQEIFLNGYLADGFMPRSSNLSKDVRWMKLSCPRCSCLLGAYASADGVLPMDGRVRFFKCYVSTSIPVREDADLFS